jgi:hypothetical protein
MVNRTIPAIATYAPIGFARWVWTAEFVSE